MATPTKKSKAPVTAPEDAPEQAPMGKEKKVEKKTWTINGVSAEDYISSLDVRIRESKQYFDKEYKLEKATKDNEQFYINDTETSNDEENGKAKHPDNRIFSSIRTIVPYVTTRVTEPEVYASSNSTESKKFAEDFEKALHIKATKEKVKYKVKFALEDAIIRRRGYLKLRYDAATKNFCAVEYVPCESIIVDHKAKPYEEPRFFRHCLDLTVEDLLDMFPDSEADIKHAFKIEPNTPRDKYYQSHKINEDWCFVPDPSGGRDLIVSWSYNKIPFGMIQDPNWRYDAENFLDNHMMPLVPINVLNDGRSWVDRTSFVEQAKHAQTTIDERTEQIGENAGLGSIGMPVVASKALADDQADFLTYEPDTAIELDLETAGVSSINEAFTTWKAGTLPADVFNDKTDAIAAVENAFGSGSVQQGSDSGNRTLGQDELLRDQSMGRQAEMVDAIDVAMERCYLLIAQFLLVYGEEEELFRSVGENAEFDMIMMNTAELDTKCEIRVKSGTSMPIDNPQRRATADKAASQQMIDPLSYWEIMDQPNAQKRAKRLVEFTANPPGFLSDVNEEIFNREAYTDIQYLKAKKTPPYREEIDKSYFDYLNKYILSGDLENPKLPQDVRQAISTFIDIQLSRGQKMLGMAETQLPTADDVNQHNAQVDEANAANAAATKGIPTAPAGAGQPTPPPEPTPQGSPADQGASQPAAAVSQ